MFKAGLSRGDPRGWAEPREPAGVSVTQMPSVRRAPLRAPRRRDQNGERECDGHRAALPAGRWEYNQSGPSCSLPCSTSSPFLSPARLCCDILPLPPSTWHRSNETNWALHRLPIGFALVSSWGWKALTCGTWMTFLGQFWWQTESSYLSTLSNS